MALQVTGAPVGISSQSRYAVLEYRCNLATLQECVKRTLDECLQISDRAETGWLDNDEDAEQEKKAAKKQARDDLRAFRYKLEVVIQTTEQWYQRRLRCLLMCLLPLNIVVLYVTLKPLVELDFGDGKMNPARALNLTMFASSGIRTLNHGSLRACFYNISAMASFGFSKLLQCWSGQSHVNDNASEILASSDAPDRMVNKQLTGSEEKVKKTESNLSDQTNHAIVFTRPSGIANQALDGHLSKGDNGRYMERESSQRNDLCTLNEIRVTETRSPPLTNLVAVIVLVASIAHIAWYEIHLRMAKQLVVEVDRLYARLERPGSEITNRDIDNVDGSRWKYAK